MQGRGCAEATVEEERSMNPGKDDLKTFFAPRSIAIVGVNTTKFVFGGISFLLKLQEANFPGKLYPINPKADEIRGIKAYPSLSSLPEVPDLVTVCVSAPHVPALLDECGRIGATHVHILTSGFKELGTEAGRLLEERIAVIAKQNGLLIIGPNCMGSYSPAAGLTAWGAIPGARGPLGVISQSGYNTQRLIEYAFSLGIGTDKAVSVGNGTVLSSLDFLEYMGQDDSIRVIAMYIEGIQDGEKFLHLSGEISKRKPIVVWKGGESEAGATTAASHTGGMAGEGRIWEAALRQSGITHVRSLEECIDAVLAFAYLPVPRGRGVFIIGGGGGNSVVYTDTCVREGLTVPAPARATMETLRQTVPAVGSIVGNPLDDWQTLMTPTYLGAILELAYGDPSTGMVLVDRLIPRKAFHMPKMPDSTLETIAQVRKKRHRKPTVFTVDAGGGDPELAAQGATLQAALGKQELPAYPSVQRAAKALMHLYRYHAWRMLS
jgi:acyl-CoA synthetase (NDP forming)